ncbi:hypothetical protein RVX_R24980 [Nitratidesulfovibrio sp. HK-II]|uniref:hypothetical protein n=1 Tax=Nitratidesulfovibrio sp. HK-II TaxID=2009266 RepID=UPI000A02F5DC|nr:hypothetical protein [Nitratidesulfovibrio sp. HK-II]
MTTMHGGLKGPDNMHVPYAWEFASQAARETGVGVDASGIGKLARQLDDNSLWMLVGTDPITWKAAGGGSSFPSGTRMLFQQTSAPTGWTKDTSHNDKALRVVSGAVGSGGNVDFSVAFGRTSTDAHTLTLSQIPSHAHGVTYTVEGGESGSDTNNLFWRFGRGTSSKSTANSGGGGAHSHGLDMRVKFVDFIIAQKD